MWEGQLRELAAFAPMPIVHTIYQRAHAGNLVDLQMHAHGSRLTAAVLFADISGFTALTEALSRHSSSGAEELTSLLNLYFTRMIMLVESYRGLVVRISGDAIIASFQVEEDNSLAAATLRALYAAVDMQAAMADFQNLQTSVGTASLGLKIGIGTGEVLEAHVGGIFNRWEYLIAGEAMEQAANAERSAQAGMVVLSDEAAHTAALYNHHLPPCVSILNDEGELQGSVAAPDENQTPSCHVKPSRSFPLVFDWKDFSAETRTTIADMLHYYVPAAITTRVSSRQHTWLAELRRMTAMFVGVGGLDYNDPDVLDHLQTFLSTTQKITYSYEGSLNKITVDDKGTVMLILFGAPPLAHEDDALRSLACARELQQTINASTAAPQTRRLDLASRASTPETTIQHLNLRIAIGIATDTFFAGPVGSPRCCEYTVMGDAVNLAARLMQAAGAGGTLCDHTTYSEGLKHWRMEALPPLLVKGKAQPVRVYRFSGLRALKQSRQRRPLIGRDQELAALLNSLDQAHQGYGCVVSLVGEGGMGKTSLLQEYMLLANQKETVAPPLLGTAHSIGQQTPYLIWREILTTYFGLERIQDRKRREHRVREQARTLDTELEQRLPLLNDILDLELPETRLTQGLAPRQRRDNLTFLIIQLLLAWTQESTLLVVLDDMHWADSLSWELALDVARAVALRPVVLVLSYRPISVGEGPAWGHVKDESLQAITRLSQHHQVDISPLDETSVAQLASLHMDKKTVAPRVVAWLTERSQGNAFFVEETVRMLREESALVLDENGVWQIKDTQSFTAIPSTLKSIIQSHLDRLKPDTQFTCKVASVIGRVFAARVVAGIYPIHEQREKLKHHLDTLAEQNITPLESYEPELRYQFKSALTQDVAYASLLMAHRQELHQSVAEWYEREYASNLDPYIPLLANHYRFTEKTLRFLDFAERAGQLAAENYATAEARDYFSQAIDVLHEQPALFPEAEQRERLFHLLLKREQVYEHTSNHEQQEKDLQELATLAEAMEYRHQATVQTRWSRYYQMINAYDVAERFAREALKQAKKYRVDDLLGEIMNLLARNAELRADYPKALWWGFQALEYCREVNDRAGEAYSLNFLGIAQAELGDYAQAEQYHRQALDIRRAIGDRWGEATSLNQIGTLALKHGKPRDALEAYQEALSIRRAIGDRSGEAFTLLSVGDTYQSLGDLSMAQQYQQQARGIWRETGNHYGEAMLLVSMCDTATALGNFEAAQNYATEGLELARTLGNRQIEAYCLSKWGNAARDQAALQKREATAPQQRHDDVAVQAQSDTVADDDGSLAMLEARPLAMMSHEHHRAALKLARDMGLRRLEAYALHHLGEWEWEWGSPDMMTRAQGAADYWEAAARIREEIGETDFARASRIRQAHAFAVSGRLEEAHTLVNDVWDAWGLNPPVTEDENELREGYLALYETWTLLHVPDRAIAALAWAYQGIHDRAVRISDPVMRRSFLMRVSINHAIIQAWDALNDEHEQNSLELGFDRNPE